MDKLSKFSGHNKMQELLKQSKIYPPRENLFRFLSLPDLLKLKKTYKDFDTSFKITDADGIPHYFDSLTPENITEYKQIQKEINEALIEASKRGPLEVVQNLLRNPDLRVNARNIYGYTALMLASKKGRLEIVRALLQNSNLDINIRDHHGYTALMFASSEGHFEVVRLLLSYRNLKINAKDGCGRTALTIAVARGRYEVVQVLLQDPRVDVNAKDYNGVTALIESTKRGRPRMVEILLGNSDIDVNAKDDKGRSALNWALGSGYEEAAGLIQSDPRIQRE